MNVPTSAPIIKIALKGGPSAGKTTILPRVIFELNNHGYLVVSTPEAATMLIANNIGPWNLGVVGFHEKIAHMQLAQETFFLSAAKALQHKYPERRKKICVILCDRGFLDIAAYLPPRYASKLLRGILKRVGMTVEQALANYAAAIHVVTAALGAEESYTLGNNPTRMEDINQAREIDARIIEAWSGHPDHPIIGNVNPSGQKISFEKKTELVISEVFRIVRKAEGVIA